MRPARIAELLEPFLNPTPMPCHSEPARSGGEEPAVLSPAQLKHISTYIDLLLRWNARINLTAIRDEEQIVSRHFGESLFAARNLFAGDHRGRAALKGRVNGTTKTRALAPEDPADDLRVADVGSGAGFPGIPLKLWAPDIALTLIESNHKKATFLREIARALTLTNVDIQITRAEMIHTTFDLVTLRAVERFETILPTAASLVAPGGRLALLIGSEQLSQARTLLPNLQWRSPIPIPLSQSRIVAIADRPTA
jgi:16S rRNA (guanine527-N7)-methyltransferase